MSDAPHTLTVTRKTVAGREVASGRLLRFWLPNGASGSACRSAARLFVWAASKALHCRPIVVPEA